jgi:hypothetical protein
VRAESREQRAESREQRAGGYSTQWSAFASKVHKGVCSRDSTTARSGQEESNYCVCSCEEGAFQRCYKGMLG